MDKINKIFKDYDREKIFFYSMIFWPIIFTINELIKFPSVLLVLIEIMIMLFYFWGFSREKFKKLILLIGIPIVVQLILLLNGSTFGSINMGDIINWAKFTIRWTEMITILFIFSDKVVLSKLKELSFKSIKYIFSYSIIIVLIEILYLFLDAGYESLWEGRYFKAYNYSPHVNSYFLIMPMIAFIYCYYNMKSIQKKAISFLGASACLGLNLLTGARTTAVIAIGIFVLVILAVIVKNKKLVIYSVIAIISLFIINYIFNIVDITKIPLFQKFIQVSNDPSGFLNGRNYIWLAQFKYIKEAFGFVNYTFGVGLAQSMRINDMYISQSLWAHNDLIETLIGGGICSLGIYIATYVQYFHKNKAYILGGILFIILFFNGLFVYSELVTFIPFITITLSMYFKDVIILLEKNVGVDI